MKLALALLFSAPAVAQTAYEPLWFDQLYGVTAQGGYVAADGSGGVLFTGSDHGSIGGPSAGSTDVIVARYDTDGAPMWIRQFGTSESDRPHAIASDGAGGAFVAGRTYGDFGGVANGAEEAFVMRVDANGNLLWVVLESTTGSDQFSGAAPDGAGGCIVLGTSTRDLYGPLNGMGTSDVVVARFDANGARTWELQFGTSTYDYPRSITGNGAGGAYVTGTMGGAMPIGAPVTGTGPSWVVQIDATGTLVSGVQFGGNGESPTAVARDGAGGVFLAGTFVTINSLGNAEIDGYATRFDSAWNQGWSQTFMTPMLHTITSSMAASGPNEFVIAGTTYAGIISPGSPGVLSDVDGFLVRMDGGGALLTRDDIDGGDSDTVESVALDGNAGVWVGGISTSDFGGTDPQFYALFLGRIGREIGARYCSPAITNSTGAPGSIVVAGSDVATDNAITLVANDLPSSSFGYFLTSETTGNVPMAGGSQGTLCLGGTIGRYNRAGEIGATGDGSSFTLRVDLTSTPSPTGSVSVMAGQTWNYQAWYRDANPNVTSNFTDAVGLTYL